MLGTKRTTRVTNGPDSANRAAGTSLAP